jgi:multiple antibiotic resistance protein
MARTHVQDLFLIFTSVLFIVDPFAVIPSFLAMTAKDDAATRRVMARRGAVTAGIVLVVFALGGSLIFKLFGITIGAFKIAGGILIGLGALDMVQAQRNPQKETPLETAEGIERQDVGILPVGIPMLAGPGAISTVMVLAGQTQTPVQVITVYAAILLTAFISYHTLAAATFVEQRLGLTGMRILTRLMGLVLCAIAVQFIVDGLKMSGIVAR